jgi:hypothetical protein
MVVHAYNPSTQEAEWEDPRLQAILGYIMGPCLKEKKS